MYEYLLNQNYKTVEVDALVKGKAVAVVLDSRNFDHFKWQGFIDLEMALVHLNINEARMMCFFAKGCFRQKDEFHWTYTGKDEYLVGLVSGRDVRGILKDGEPYLINCNKLPEYVVDPKGKSEETNNKVVNIF